MPLNEESRHKKFFKFLQYIKKHRRYCTNELAEELGTSPKTITRYHKKLKELFGVEFVTISRGCYAIKDVSIFKDFLFDGVPDRESQLVFDLLAMIHPKVLSYFGFSPKEVERLLQDNESVYLIKESPFEDLVNSQILEQLKEAIKEQYYSDILYHPHNRLVYEDVKPLRIVYAEGNWYLAVLTQDEINNGFKFLRINFIKKIQLKPKKFRRDSTALYFLQTFQSLFSAYNQYPRSVLVEVDEEVARYFRVKKFLASQRIVKDQGKLTIQYTITNDEEILFLAKRWMPHMHILEPKHLQEELEECVREFLRRGHG
ncbi:MAG: WYL domain-containing protein [Epsilonproteobacteria bacterium]|nr:WYL domain-containing protein [Campylobacterota bacterium]